MSSSPSTAQAKQPNNPSGSCQPWWKPEPPKPTPPVVSTNEPCCGESNGPKGNCLEDLINQQTKAEEAADKKKGLKAELVKILDLARAASQAYNLDIYATLLERWKKQDRDIAELLRRLDCSIPNWSCVVDCYVCPLLNGMRESERKLGELEEKWPNIPEQNDLYALRYWGERDVEIKQRRLDRVSSILKVWEKPATGIEKVLDDNAKLVIDLMKVIGTGDAKIVYDIFFKLVPKHLAIAPPVVEGAGQIVTTIDAKYTQLCLVEDSNSESEDTETEEKNDSYALSDKTYEQEIPEEESPTSNEPDNCCGPDVGLPSLLSRIIGPLPYLIEPIRYMDIICCLATQRFQPAWTDLAEANGWLTDINSQITRCKSHIEKGLKSFEADAKAVIPSVPPPCNCEEPDSPSDSKKGATYPTTNAPTGSTSPAKPTAPSGATDPAPSGSDSNSYGRKGPKNSHYSDPDETTDITL